MAGTDSLRLPGMDLIVGPIPMTVGALYSRYVNIASRGPGIYVVVLNAPFMEGLVASYDMTGQRGIPQSAALDSSYRPVPNVFMWNIKKGAPYKTFAVQAGGIPELIIVKFSLYMISWGATVYPRWPGQQSYTPPQLMDAVNTITEVIGCIDMNTYSVRFLENYGAILYNHQAWSKCLPYMKKLVQVYSVGSDVQKLATYRNGAQVCQFMHDQKVKTYQRQNLPAQMDGPETKSKIKSVIESMKNMMLSSTEDQLTVPVRNDINRPSSAPIPERQEAPVNYTHSDDDSGGAFFEASRNDFEEPSFVRSWFQDMQEFVSGPLSSTHQNTEPVRVAILDTGIDGRHNTFVIDRNRIAAFKDFTHYGERSEWPPAGTSSRWKPPKPQELRDYFVDTSGHGTAVASMFLRTDPLGRLYVARIAQNKRAVTSDVVAQAVEYAKQQWQVDIIILSLGFKSLGAGDRLYKLLDTPEADKLLVFSAASNEPYQPTQWPARMPSVFCVTSTSSLGHTWAPFSPIDREEYSNYSAPGDRVQVADLSEMSDSSQTADPRRTKITGGNSYAAPVVAAVASLVLEFARQFVAYNPGSPVASALDPAMLKSRYAMRTVLNEMRQKQAGASIYPKNVIRLQMGSGSDQSYHRAAYAIDRALNMG